MEGYFPEAAGAFRLERLEDRALLSATPSCLPEGLPDHLAIAVAQIDCDALTGEAAVPSRSAAAERKPAILLIPGSFGSLPTQFDLDSAVDFSLGRGFAPESLGPAGRLYDTLISRLSRLSGYAMGSNLFFAAYDWRLPVAPADGKPDGLLRVKGVNFDDDRYRFGIEYMAYWMDQARAAWVERHGDAKGFRVNIIAQGAGAVIARAFVQSSEFRSRHAGAVHKFITLGGSDVSPLAMAFQRDAMLADWLEGRGADDDLVDAASALGLAGKALGLVIPGLSSLLPATEIALRAFADGQPAAEAARNLLFNDLIANPGRFRRGVDKVIMLPGLDGNRITELSKGSPKTSFSLQGEAYASAASALFPVPGLAEMYDLSRGKGLRLSGSVIGDVLRELR